MRSGRMFQRLELRFTRQGTLDVFSKHADKISGGERGMVCGGRNTQKIDLAAPHQILADRHSNNWY